jgi:hypothetical protein
MALSEGKKKANHNHRSSNEMNTQIIALLCANLE